MISTCRSEVAAKILVRSTTTGLAVPSRSTVILVVPVVAASMRGRTPIASEISMAGRNRSTACPPVLRSRGARSTTVTSKPCLTSQYASTGPGDAGARDEYLHDSPY